MAALDALAEDDGLFAGSDDYPATPDVTGAMPPRGGALTTLDTPGTQAAMKALMESSTQARAALQQAREKISARKYNRAIALLAVSGALGQPTRTGAAAEGWANAANALVGPLREKAQFEENKDKELLGIDTSIAGIDERMAMSQLQLEQLRAKQLAEERKVPNEIIIDENGNPVYNAPWDARGKKAHTPSAASTNVSLNTAKGFFDNLSEKRSTATDALYEAAQSAPETIERAKRVKDAVKKGAITGTGAELKLGLGKVLKTLGWDDAQDWVADTETMAAQLAKGTLDLIGPSKLGGGSGFSNADREFLNKVSGNKITLDAKTIERLMDLQIKAQKGTVKRWNSTYDRITAARKDSKENMDIMGYMKIDVPEDEEEAAALAAAQADAEAAASNAAQMPPPTQPPAGAVAPRASGIPPLLARPAAAPPAAASPSAPPKYGFVNPNETLDPSTPTPRAPPEREQHLRDNPETAQQFLDHYKYLPPDFL